MPSCSSLRTSVVLIATLETTLFEKSTRIRLAIETTTLANQENMEPKPKRGALLTQSAKTDIGSQMKAKRLTEQASKAADPQERERLLKDALGQSSEPRSQGKKGWLESGGVQGALGGAGAGTAVGAGLGTVTGTLVGGASSVAVGGVGAAVGGGVGIVHGPFMKLAGGNKHGGPNEAKELVAKSGAKHTIAGQPNESQALDSATSRKKPKKLQVRAKKD